MTPGSASYPEQKRRNIQGLGFFDFSQTQVRWMRSSCPARVCNCRELNFTLKIRLKRGVYCFSVQLRDMHIICLVSRWRSAEMSLLKWAEIMDSARTHISVHPRSSSKLPLHSRCIFRTGDILRYAVLRSIPGSQAGGTEGRGDEGAQNRKMRGAPLCKGEIRFDRFSDSPGPKAFLLHSNTIHYHFSVNRWLSDVHCWY